MCTRGLGFLATSTCTPERHSTHWLLGSWSWIVHSIQSNAESLHVPWEPLCLVHIWRWMSAEDHSISDRHSCSERREGRCVGTASQNLFTYSGVGRFCPLWGQFSFLSLSCLEMCLWTCLEVYFLRHSSSQNQLYFLLLYHNVQDWVTCKQSRFV